MNTLIPMRKVILKFQITDLLIFKTNTVFLWYQNLALLWFFESFCRLL